MSPKSSNIPVVLCCAEDSEIYLINVVEALREEGLAPEVLSGVEADGSQLGRAVDRNRGAGVYVLCESEGLDRAAIRRLDGLFSARRGPRHRLVVVRINPQRPLTVLPTIREAVEVLRRSASSGGASASGTGHNLRDVIGPTQVDAVRRPGRPATDPPPDTPDELARQLTAAMEAAEAALDRRRSRARVQQERRQSADAPRFSPPGQFPAVRSNAGPEAQTPPPPAQERAVGSPQAPVPSPWRPSPGQGASPASVQESEAPRTWHPSEFSRQAETPRQPEAPRQPETFRQSVPVPPPAELVEGPPSRRSTGDSTSPDHRGATPPQPAAEHPHRRTSANEAPAPILSPAAVQSPAPRRASAPATPGPRGRVSRRRSLGMPRGWLLMASGAVIILAVIGFSVANVDRAPHGREVQAVVAAEQESEQDAAKQATSGHTADMPATVGMPTAGLAEAEQPQTDGTGGSEPRRAKPKRAAGAAQPKRADRRGDRARSRRAGRRDRPSREQSRQAEPAKPQARARPESEPEPEPQRSALDRKLDAAIAEGKIHEHKGVLWLDPSETSMDWQGAAGLCSVVRVDGIVGWRLPSRGELRRLRGAAGLPSGTYWSRTEGQTDAGEAGAHVLTSGGLQVQGKEAEGRALCVRRR